MMKTKAILVMILMLTCAVQAYTVDAGLDQTVQVYDANTVGVLMAATISDPNGGENLTYAWSSDPGGAVFDASNIEDPIVKFGVADEYTLTLVVTSDQGGDSSDTVTITVIVPTVDAGTGQEVTQRDAALGLQLDGSISDVYGGEIYTYLWTSNPGWDSITDANILDPIVTFDSVGSYTLTLTATGDVNGAFADSVMIVVIAEKVLVTHFAINDNEHKGPIGPDRGFKDSSLEGHPDNHRYWLRRYQNSWDDKRGVVGCDDNGSMYADDDEAVVMALNHLIPGFDDNAPHLDNITTGLTVALWFKGEDDKSVILIEKEFTFRMRIDRNGGDLRLYILKEQNKWTPEDGTTISEGRWTVTKSRSDDVGQDFYRAGLNLRGNNGESDDNAWHHLAMTYRSASGVVRLYVDGVKVVDDNDKFDPGDLIASYDIMGADGEKPLALGGQYTGNDLDMRRGGFDDVRIYNYALEEHEVAELASMGESVAMVYAGKSSHMTGENSIDPNTLPIQLEGAYIRLGRGTDRISEGGGDYRVTWEKQSGPGDVIFTNTSDPITYVTFTQAGTYRLRLRAYARFCGEDSDHYDSVSVVVDAPTDCAGYLALGGDNVGDFDGDCDVDDVDLRTMALNWLDVSYP